MTSKKTDTYEVGDRKPPKSTQFKKGRSGNPLGRRRGRGKTIDATRLLDPRLTVTKDGRPHEMSAYEVYLRRLVSQALEDKKVMAIKTLLELFEEHSILVPPPPPLGGGYVVRVPKQYDFRDYADKVRQYGPPPWPPGVKAKKKNPNWHLEDIVD
jgi:hypothetical protein